MLIKDKIQKQQELTIEQVFQKIQNLSIKNQLNQLLYTYQLKYSLDAIYSNCSIHYLESFGKNFFKVMIFKLIHKYRSNNQKNMVQANLEFKRSYLQFFKNIRKNRNLVIQFYQFLLSFIVKNIIQSILKIKIDQKELLNISQASYIAINYQTLGYIINSSIYNLLYKKYIIKDKSLEIKQSFITWCLSQQFINQHQNQHRDNIHSIEKEEFSKVLRQTLEVRKYVNKKKTHKRVESDGIQQTVGTTLEDQVNDRKYRNTYIKSDQISSSLDYLSSKRLRYSNDGIHIYVNPIQTSMLFQNHKNIQKIPQNLKASVFAKKRQKKRLNRLDTNQWKSLVKDLKENISKKLIREPINLHSQKIKNQFTYTPEQPKISNYQNRQIKSSKRERLCKLLTEKSQEIDRIQLGIVTKVQNYPCPVRKQLKSQQVTRMVLKKQKQQFSKQCLKRKMVYRDQSVNEMLARQISINQKFPLKLMV